MRGDTWTHLLARLLVRPLLDTWVRPNHLTTLRLVTGLAACAVFMLGSRAAMWWGGGLWLISAFLDRADGELARIGNMMSRGGHLYDYYADVTVNSLFFISIGIGLQQSWLGTWSLALGAISSVAMLLCGILCHWFEASGPPGTRSFSGRWGFDPDDALYLMTPFAWLGLLPLVLIGASIGATVMMSIIAVRLSHSRRMAQPVVLGKENT
jgi:archaetidylinositol phosphate synthase